MKITIRGFQGTGKTKLAERIARGLIKQGRRVRVIDGCMSFTHPKVKGVRAARRGPWDVIIRVLQLPE